MDRSTVIETRDIKMRIAIDQIRKQFPLYQNITELKTGGQKTVYNAVHCDYGNVVLKIAKHDGNDPRTLREIEIVKRNSFPNVPLIYEVGNATINNNSFIYICEKRITGTDLRAILDKSGKLPLSIVLKFLDNMLNTVTKLEEQNIVHRDI